MKVFAYLSLLATVSALATGSPPVSEHEVKRNTEIKNRADLDITNQLGLEKRACRSNGCKCKKGTKQGQYCGVCPQVINQGSGGDLNRDIYECNNDGGCCDYGPADHCHGVDPLGWCPK